jgi:hypothetical protein
MSTELVKQTFDLAAPQEAMKVATELQRFVTEKKLTANIKGKNYPLVEAWQFAGSQLGLYPVLISTQRIYGIDSRITDPEIKYSATVEIRRLSDERILSRGDAICSNKEASKRAFDEYAILSMAQTRAEGKAYRMLLSWLMKAAGFEATPAEEMDFAKVPEPDFSDIPDEGERQILRNLVYTSDLTNEEKESAMSAIDLCKTYETYQKIQHRLEARQLGVESMVNPSQADINKHLKKVVK